MKKETLLEKAKKVKGAKRRSYLSGDVEGKIEVIKAWLKDEVSMNQMSVSLYNRPRAMECYPLIACTLREMYRRGELKIK